MVDMIFLKDEIMSDVDESVLLFWVFVPERPYVDEIWLMVFVIVH